MSNANDDKNDTYKELRYYNAVRLNYIDNIDSILKNGYKNKAILSFKYDHLNLIINTMQILIILISACLTLMESIKTYYNSENEAIDITAILFTSFIGIIMTLYRFLKLENKKERTGTILENYHLILNKLHRIRNTMNNMVIKPDNLEEWAIIANNFTSEILTTYITIKESFDNSLTYKEIIYYKDKYSKFLLKEKFVGNELKTIYNFKEMPHTEFMKSSKICGVKGKKIDYNKFILQFDAENTRRSKEKRKGIKTNQQLYFEYFMNEKGLNNKNDFFDDKSRFKYYRPRTTQELEDGYDSEVSTEPPGSPGCRNRGFIEETREDIVITPDSQIMKMHIEPPPGMRLADIDVDDKSIAELLKQNKEAEDSIKIEIDDENSRKVDTIKSNFSLEL